MTKFCVEHQVDLNPTFLYYSRVFLATSGHFVLAVKEKHIGGLSPVIPEHFLDAKAVN